MSFVITIDGPSAAGKSTTARGLADRLGIPFLDTGALYRVIALLAIERGVAPSDEAAIAAAAAEAQLELEGAPHDPRVRLDGRDVTRDIRTPEVSELSSRLATLPAVRRRLVELQRKLASRGPVVAEGRDLGTVVFPSAKVKIYLDANLDTRAERRTRELHGRGIARPIADVRIDLERRDERDRTRADSPMKAAPDAVHVDTTGLSLDEQVEAVLRVVRAHPECPKEWRSSAGTAT